MSTLSSLLKQEQETAAIVQQTVAQIVREISQSKRRGILVSVTPAVTIVSFSQIDRTILSPEYYDPVTQGRIVAQSLRGISTASGLLSRLNTLVTDRKVGPNQLNSETLAILTRYCNAE